MTAIETIVGAVTVNDVDCETPAKFAEIFVDPAAVAATRPVPLMVAVAVVEELQETSAVMSALLPSLYVPVAVNCCVVLTGIEDDAGNIEIDNRLTAAAVTVSEPLDLSEPDCA